MAIYKNYKGKEYVRTLIIIEQTLDRFYGVIDESNKSQQRSKAVSDVKRKIQDLLVRAEDDEKLYPPCE